MLKYYIVIIPTDSPMQENRPPAAASAAAAAAAAAAANGTGLITLLLPILYKHVADRNAINSSQRLFSNQIYQLFPT